MNSRRTSVFLGWFITVLTLLGNCTGVDHIKSLQDLRGRARTPRSASARTECLAKLICGMNVGTGEPHSRQTQIITNFLRDKKGEMAAVVHDDDYIDSPHDQHQLRSVDDYDASDWRSDIGSLERSLNWDTPTPLNQRKWNAKLKKFIEDYTRSTKESTMEECNEIEGCPYTFQKLRSTYKFSTTTWNNPNYQGLKGEVEGYDDEVDMKNKQLTIGSGWTRPRPPPPPPPFWMVKTPPEFWESDFGKGWGQQGGGGKKGKGKKGKKGKGGKGKKGKGKKGKCKKGKGKGKGKGKKGGNCGENTSSEEERKFHTRLRYFLAEQQRINDHKASLTWRIGGRPMAVQDHKDVPVTMTHGHSPSLAAWGRPLNQAFNNLGRIIGSHSGVFYSPGNDHRNGWGHG